jgi:D-cysteine desulfhydrase family pyridoxal phosphate-dependent enzyme
VRLAALPTPLEPARRLGAALGLPELWVKRDDLTALGLGGNKVRKLEFALGAALDAGCDTVVTFGALQSNHARQTAAACARLGLGCELVLTRAVPVTGPAFERSGNLLLDDLFGATVHVVAHDDAALAATVDGVRHAVAARGGRAWWVPPGGSDAVGTLGYVAAGLELAAQARDAGIDLAHAVVATSTGGTQAGLLTGLRLAGSTAAVHGVAVYRDEARTHEAVAALATSVAEALGTEAVDPADVSVDGSFRGGGYGLPTPAMWAALDAWARTEGVVLDPVYSGKAAAARAGWAADGRLAGGATVFLHTGGSPGLFAYADLRPTSEPT